MRIPYINSLVDPLLEYYLKREQMGEEHTISFLMMNGEYSTTYPTRMDELDRFILIPIEIETESSTLILPSVSLFSFINHSTNDGIQFR